MSSTTTDTTEEQILRLAQDVDVGWVLANTFLIFFMQAGFSLLEAGAVRIKNVANILLKNLMCTALSTLGWFGLGYGLAFGKGFFSNGVFGIGSFFLLDDDTSIFSHFMVQWALCSVSVTLCAGAVAERMNLTSYFCYNFLMSSMIYPIIAHSFWSSSGWLSPHNHETFRLGTVGFMDYGGGTVVHVTGGIVGLMGTILLGPRMGRFRNGKAIKIHGHSKTLMLLGSWIIWLGFYGITASAGTEQLSSRSSDLCALAAINTTIAAATGALTTLFVHCIRSGRYDLTEGMNGALAGCVAITPCCVLIFPWSSFFIGCMASVVYFVGCWTLEKVHVDDPLSTVPIHALCGAAGTILGNGLLSSKKYVSRAYQIPEGDPIEYGLLMGGGFQQFGIQCLGVTLTVLYALTCSFFMFYVLSRTLGLRVRKEVELRGLDLYEGGGIAYALQNAAADLLPPQNFSRSRKRKRTTGSGSKRSGRHGSSSSRRKTSALDESRSSGSRTDNSQNSQREGKHSTGSGTHSSHHYSSGPITPSGNQMPFGSSYSSYPRHFGTIPAEFPQFQSNSFSAAFSSNGAQMRHATQQSTVNSTGENLASQPFTFSNKPEVHIEMTEYPSPKESNQEEISLQITETSEESSKPGVESTSES